MTERRVALALALALFASPVLADEAKSRGGGSGGSGGSHHGSTGVRSSGSGGGSSHSSGAASGGSFSDAERRHPRPGTGTGGRYYGGGRFYRSYYPFYSTAYYPYGYYYPYSDFYYGYGYSPYYGRPYRSYGYRPVGSVRLLVEPDQARVYVDGYYAGVVDDFDGLFQRLHTSPGRHEITLKLEGYRTYRMRVYVPVDQTIKIHYDMIKGSGEDVAEAVGEPSDDPKDADERYARREDAEDRDEDAPAPPEGDGESGSLRLSVHPADASVYVDGEFRGGARDLQVLRLPAGHHRIEVVRPGYRTYERDVEVRPGQTAEVDVDLRR